MSRKIKPIISVVLVTIALAAAAYYLDTHKPLVQQLIHTPLIVIVAVLALYGAMFIVLMLILSATIKICNRKLDQTENTQLNANSLLINFFIPGQGGPIYRGIYLYKQHRLRVKNYLIATMLYYVMYGVISVFMLLVAVRPWWQTGVATVALSGLGLIAVRLYSRKVKMKKDSMNLGLTALSYLFIATLIQSVIQVAIYAIELHTAANGHIALSRVITYTGAANLALFVSLTPGAIGIRESFLMFTRNLHHISSSNIVVANVIDRSVYLVFLLILIGLSVALQMRGRLQIKKLPILLKQPFSIKNTSASSVRNN